MHEVNAYLTSFRFNSSISSPKPFGSGRRLKSLHHQIIILFPSFLIHLSHPEVPPLSQTPYFSRQDPFFPLIP